MGTDLALAANHSARVTAISSFYSFECIKNTFLRFRPDRECTCWSFAIKSLADRFWTSLFEKHTEDAPSLRSYRQGSRPFLQQYKETYLLPPLFLSPLSQFHQRGQPHLFYDHWCHKYGSIPLSVGWRDLGSLWNAIFQNILSSDRCAKHTFSPLVLESFPVVEAAFCKACFLVEASEHGDLARILSLYDF